MLVNAPTKIVALQVNQFFNTVSQLTIVLDQDSEPAQRSEQSSYAHSLESFEYE